MSVSPDRSAIVRLEALPAAVLADLAAGRRPTGLRRACEEGALPPPEVARRALRLQAEGVEARWSLPYAMIDEGGTLVGACGFKGPPSLGVVEIGYAVAPARRGRGIAAAAVRLLLEKAIASGDARRVLARINPDNAASARVADKLGFVRGEVRPDDDGEPLAQWLWPAAIDFPDDGDAS
ncbi:GNAT family N-acetyltransferase [Chromobacterium violaceum]|uniref:GNAT family N-acetyltransferase n=1 Tax=Chromobacterium violaceum TaxID=536 RepID=UPI001592FB42|nr:GNAT family N-acetyltransferase [Chromobacterium violaceum]